MISSEPDNIETIFLCQGCQTGESVARKLASFVREAQHSIDFCAYSLRLCAEYTHVLVSALRDREKAGVRVRIAYDAGTQQSAFAPGRGYDPCLVGNEPTTAEFVRSLGFPSRAIEGERTLMHHKYVVIDADMPGGAVWTGSANFSDESWTLQENNILILRSQPLAALYAHDFEELWKDAHIKSEGLGDSGEVTLFYGGEPAHVLVNFSPGEGEWIDEMIARQVERTEERVTFAFVVLTSGRILSALLTLMERGVPFDGIYDFSQMEGVKYQWKTVPANHWKIGAFEDIVRYGNLLGKGSTPYTVDSPHDYMHNKVMVLDNVTITGSYNFSRHAQRNAENLLLITSVPLARTYRDYIASIVAKYSSLDANDRRQAGR